MKSKTQDRNKALKAFTMHGINIKKISGNQAISDCILCNKKNHFYINTEKLLWDCKICGATGNLYSILNNINERNKQNLNQKVLRRLSRDRKLPISAFQGIELGYNKNWYTFAIRNAQNKIQDLRLFKLSHKVISTSNTKTGLFGLTELLAKPNDPVYICEGEWDTIAMRHLLKKAKAKGVAVCSPGANVFKVEWTEFFKSTKVYVCYDNDKAGENGQLNVYKKLAGIASSISFLHWPNKLEVGYDIKDFYIENYIKIKKPKTALKKLLGYMRNKPKLEVKENTSTEIAVKEAPKIDPNITLQDGITAFKNKLHLPSEDAIKLCFVAMISNLYCTRPLWFFIVAPPSSGKTEIINGFKYLGQPYDNLAHFTSNLTPHTLISGMKTNKDPSLLALFENNPMTLFIKDFTTLLSLPEHEKSEIFGQMRDAHDGYSAKDFGNGVLRRYNNLNFAIVAGVTYQIYNEASSFAALGERFAKFILPAHNGLDEIMKMMSKSMANIGKEENLDDHVAQIIYSAVKNLFNSIIEKKEPLPELPLWAQTQISNISLYTSYMRGSVARDKFRRDLIKSKPTVESPMRFCVSLATIAKLLAKIEGRKVVNEDDLRITRKIALDTVNQRDEEILRKTYLLSSSEYDEPTKRNIQEASSYTSFTVDQVIQDFAMVGVLKTRRVNRKLYYELSKNMRDILSKANIYKSKEELNRKNIILDSLGKPLKSRSGQRKKLTIKKRRLK